MIVNTTTSYKLRNFARKETTCATDRELALLLADLADEDLLCEDMINCIGNFGYGIGTKDPEVANSLDRFAMTLFHACYQRRSSRPLVNSVKPVVVAAYGFRRF